MGKAVGARLEFGMGHRLAGLRHDEGGLIGPGARVLARVHNGTLSPTNRVDHEFAKVRLPCCGFILVLLTAVNPVGTATGFVLSSNSGVMTTIRDLGQRGLVLWSLREGIDTSNATGRRVAGVLASLAELELELGRERRSAAREARRARGQSIGRPKALDAAKATLAQRMHTNGEPASPSRHKGGGPGYLRNRL